MGPPTKNHHPLIWHPDQSALKPAMKESRLVACELPLALEYNCVSHAVMMVSPFHLEDFARGFSLTEGIIDHHREILDFNLSPPKNGDTSKGFVAALEIAPDRFERLEKFKRLLVGRTGCGLCGIDRLEHAIRPLKALKNTLTVTADIIHSSMQKLSGLQVQNKKTGALHAAAFVTATGDILCIREDIGRHNALDKMIGHMMAEDINPADGFALITSRCSFEMVHKCATFGIPILAAVSATTDLAIELAKGSGLTLIAFTRRDGMNIYCDPQNHIL